MGCPRQHAVFGGHPAASGAAHEGGNPIFDTGSADHLGIAKLDQHRARGVLREPAREPHLAKLVGDSTTGSLGACHACLPLCNVQQTPDVILVRATVRSSAGADYNRRGAVECATECVRGPSMVRSMTAFARVDVPLDSGSLQWEIRSVNHRHLEPQFRLPDAFRELEFPLRDLIRSKLKRGKVDSTLRFVAAAPSAHLEINRPVLLHLLATIEQLRRDTPEAATSRSARVVALAGRARRIAAGYARRRTPRSSPASSARSRSSTRTDRAKGRCSPN